MENEEANYRNYLPSTNPIKEKERRKAWYDSDFSMEDRGQMVKRLIWQLEMTVVNNPRRSTHLDHPTPSNVPEYINRTSESG